MHVGKIKYRYQHQEEQARLAQHVQLRVRVFLLSPEFSLGWLRRLGTLPQRELEAKKDYEGEKWRCWRAPRARGQDQVP